MVDDSGGKCGWMIAVKSDDSVGKCWWGCRLGVFGVSALVGVGWRWLVWVLAVVVLVCDVGRCWQVSGVGNILWLVRWLVVLFCW